MKYVDLNILADTPSAVQDLTSLGEAIGYSGLAIAGLDPTQYSTPSTIDLFPRFDAQAKRLSALKKELAKVQGKYLVHAVPLGGVETANWAAEEPLVDILTLLPSEKERLRKTTARLAAKNDTALEVPIQPLLYTHGLNRSRILKEMTDAIKIALQCDMRVVLTSGAGAPLQLRSPYAMTHIGMFLGLSQAKAVESISENPLAIIERNIRRFDDRFVRPGLEIVGETE